MALIVQKFGGTSVGDIDRIQHVSKIVANTRKQGHDVIVVVSAMQGETDRLIDLANTVVTHPNAREYDALIATGEQVSAALLSMSLISAKHPARSYAGFQAGIQTNDHHRKAQIMNIKTENIRLDIHEGRIPVIAGFQGINDHGHITTIGRGGSDVTAVALAAALNADECQVYTDVEGVFTSDPRIVKDARLLSQITFEEMFELAALGAKVLQRRAVEFAKKHQVPVRVLSTFQEGEGTLITFAKEEQAQPQVSGIAFDRDQAKITVLGIPNDNISVSQILTAMDAADIDVDMIIQNVVAQHDDVDFSFTVHMDDYQEALRITKKIALSLSAREVIADNKIAKLSIVGLGMKTHASVASKMLQALGEEGIHIHLITSSEVKISTVIDEKYLELGARTLHAAFNLEHPH
jgi:aspartate kinase